MKRILILLQLLSLFSPSLDKINAKLCQVVHITAKVCMNCLVNCGLHVCFETPGMACLKGSLNEDLRAAWDANKEDLQLGVLPLRKRVLITEPEVRDFMKGDFSGMHKRRDDRAPIK